MPPLKRATVIKLPPSSQRSGLGSVGSFLKMFFLFTAGLDIGRGCVGNLRELPSLLCWEFYPEEAICGELEALEMVPVGYVEVKLLILWNEYIHIEGII